MKKQTWNLITVDGTIYVVKKNGKRVRLIKVISLGGGLQSTALLLLSLHGVIERADCAVFADTGWERQATYDNVAMLKEYAKQFDFPIYTVKGYTSVRDQALNPTHYDFVYMPVYQKRANTPVRQKGQTKRQCTDWFKLKPIKEFLKNEYGKTAYFERWIGISLDEAMRMRESDVLSEINRYPLAMELRWTRANCAEWLVKQGFGIPSKSACIGCPYHGNDTWLALTEEERQDVIELDESLRDLPVRKGKEHRQKPKLTQKGQGELIDLQEFDDRNDIESQAPDSRDLQYFLHQGCRELREFFDSPDLQLEIFPDLENEECTGMCFL